MAMAVAPRQHLGSVSCTEAMACSTQTLFSASREHFGAASPGHCLPCGSGHCCQASLALPVSCNVPVCCPESALCLQGAPTCSTPLALPPPERISRTFSRQSACRRGRV